MKRDCSAWPLPKAGKALQPEPDWRKDARPLRQAVEQLNAYFAGDLRTFDLPLRMEGNAVSARRLARAAGHPVRRDRFVWEIARRVGRRRDRGRLGWPMVES